MNMIEDLLLHRAPFLFVNDIRIDDGKILGSYSFPENSDFFQGHFPNQPIVPGVLLIESMVQCGGAGVKLIEKSSSSLFVLMKVEQASFHRIVRPDEEVTMIIETLTSNGKLLNQKGKAFVESKLVAKAEWICIDNSQ